MAETFPDLQLERSKNGKVTIMSPVNKGSGKLEAYLITIVGYWVIQNELGESYSSSTGIELPDGAIKSPDCAWVSDQRLLATANQSDDEYLKVVPDFVVELRSKSDRVSSLQKKMEDIWMQNGVRLAWLIDPYQEKAWIYRERRDPQLIEGFSDKILSGEEVMPGLELPLNKLSLK
ncbi:MAG: Uma2 family endonuclease [Saprospiraceae bacterium]|nr:Uma2 family endonuclease [Lewinella sp.]